MNSRILKHYEDAVRACRMNKLVDVSELPCPPGYPPLPSQGAAANGACKFSYSSLDAIVFLFSIWHKSDQVFQ